LADGSVATLKLRASNAERRAANSAKRAAEAESRASIAEARVKDMEDELVLLRAMKEETWSSLKSEANQLQGRQMRDSLMSMSDIDSPATVPKHVHEEAVKVLEEQVRLQQTQLQSMRDASQKDLDRRESQGSVPASTASTSVGSSTTSSMFGVFGEEENAQEFLSPVNGLQVKRSPKVKLQHGAQRVVNVHRLTITEKQPQQKLLSPRPSEGKERPHKEEPSRHSQREKNRNHRYHKTGSSSQFSDIAGDSWSFPTLSGIYSAFAGPDEEAKDSSESSDEPQTRTSKSKIQTSSSRSHSHKARR